MNYPSPPSLFCCEFPRNYIFDYFFHFQGPILIPLFLSLSLSKMISSYAYEISELYFGLAESLRNNIFWYFDYYQVFQIITLIFMLFQQILQKFTFTRYSNSILTTFIIWSVRISHWEENIYSFLNRIFKMWKEMKSNYHKKDTILRCCEASWYFSSNINEIKTNLVEPNVYNHLFLKYCCGQIRCLEIRIDSKKKKKKKERKLFSKCFNFLCYCHNGRYIGHKKNIFSLITRW